MRGSSFSNSVIVTLCPATVGWKNAQIPNSTSGVYKAMCGDANTTRDIVDCVEKKTFAPEDAVINAFRGFTVPTADLTEPRQEKDFDFQLSLFNFFLHNFYLNCRYWTWDVTNAMQGRCYTIQYDQKLHIEMEKDSLIINLNKELRLSVFLHQPGLFLLTYNSLTMPTLDLVLDHTEVGDSYLTLMLEVVQHQRLSRKHIQKERKRQCVKV